eukprot:UN31708
MNENDNQNKINKYESEIEVTHRTSVPLIVNGSINRKRTHSRSNTYPALYVTDLDKQRIDAEIQARQSVSRPTLYDIQSVHNQDSLCERLCPCFFCTCCKCCCKIFRDFPWVLCVTLIVIYICQSMALDASKKIRDDLLDVVDLSEFIVLASLAMAIVFICDTAITSTSVLLMDNFSEYFARHCEHCCCLGDGCLASCVIYIGLYGVLLILFVMLVIAVCALWVAIVQIIVFTIIYIIMLLLWGICEAGQNCS